MKNGRQERIIEIISEKEIGTQEEIADILNKEGYNVTQATISRDIRDLKLVKIANAKGTLCYHYIENANSGSGSNYIKMLQGGFKSAEVAGNILVIKTMTGSANAVAAAIDALKFTEIIGTLAGDDVIMCVVKNEETGYEIKKKIEEYI